MPHPRPLSRLQTSTTDHNYRPPSSGPHSNPPSTLATGQVPPTGKPSGSRQPPPAPEAPSQPWALSPRPMGVAQRAVFAPGKSAFSEVSDADQGDASSGTPEAQATRLAGDVQGRGTQWCTKVQTPTTEPTPAQTGLPLRQVLTRAEVLQAGHSPEEVHRHTEVSHSTGSMDQAHVCKLQKPQGQRPHDAASRSACSCAKHHRPPQDTAPHKPLRTRQPRDVPGSRQGLGDLKRAVQGLARWRSG